MAVSVRRFPIGQSDTINQFAPSQGASPYDAMMIRTPAALIPYLFAAVAVFSGALWHEGDSVEDSAARSRAARPASAGLSRLSTRPAPTHAQGFSRPLHVGLFRLQLLPRCLPHHTWRDGRCAGAAGIAARARRAHFRQHRPGARHAVCAEGLSQILRPRFRRPDRKPESHRQAAAAYRVYFKRHPLKDGGYAMDHSDVIYLMAPTAAS